VAAAYPHHQLPVGLGWCAYGVRATGRKSVGMVDGRHRPSCHSRVADLAVVASVSVVQPRAPRTDGHATVAILGVHDRTRLSWNGARHVPVPLLPGVCPCLFPGASRFGRGRGKMASTAPVAGIEAGGNYSVVTSQFRVLFAIELSPSPDARSMRVAQRRAAHRGLSLRRALTDHTRFGAVRSGALRLDLRTAAEKAQRPASGVYSVQSISQDG